MTSLAPALPASAPATSRAENCRPVTFRQLADGYMAAYTGRDPSRVPRVAWWVDRFGDRLVADISDEDIYLALEELSAGPARYFAGRDAQGRPILRSRGKRSPATVNRYHATLGALLRFAMRKRLVPKGWQNPARQIERHPEHNERVRFLSAAERARLLAVCQTSSWSKLYLLVLLAITTGARRGELVGLRWRDLDLDQRVAHIARTKNGQPKTLALTEAAVAELKRLAEKPDRLVFASDRRADKPREFDAVWSTALGEARIANFRFHDLRHTCASYLAQSGASLLEIADVLGHRNTSVTKRYSHLTIDTKARLVNRVLGDIR